MRLLRAIPGWWLALLLAVLTFPVLLLQARKLRAEIPRVGAAPGPASGVVGGDPPTVTVLGFGDSVIAGTGLGRVEDTVTPVLAAALAERRGGAVAWSAHGVDGDKIADMLPRVPLLPRTSSTSEVILLVSVGVNDVTGLTSLLRFQTGLFDLITGLHQRWPRARILLMGLPSLGRFPGVPWPLRTFMGARARLLDAVVERTAEIMEHTSHLDMHARFDASMMADDGVHPDANAHRSIAEALLQKVESRG